LRDLPSFPTRRSSDLPYVSRRHCAIHVFPDGDCVIQDLGSTDGVYVDGERIKDPLWLKDGDEIRVGGRRLVLLASVNGTANPEPDRKSTRLNSSHDQI